MKILISLFIVACIAWYFYRASKGIPRRLDQLDRAIADLLDLGYNGGSLVIDHKGSKVFFQFSKYQLSKENYGIEYVLPNAEWSEDYFSPIREMVSATRLSYKIDQGSDHEMEFLTVDFGSDAEEAFRFIKKIAREIFKLPPDASYYVLLQNAALPEKPKRK